MRLIESNKVIPLVRLILLNRPQADVICENMQKLVDIHTIEVDPVKHGRWIVKNGRIVCDQCEALWAVCPNKDVQEEEMKMVYKTEKFCYNCGAKMGGGADHD